jgi:hypothetical protein
MLRIKEVLRLNQLRGLSDAARGERIARAALMQSGIRQNPSCFEASIALPTGPDNGKSHPGPATGNRNPGAA